MATKKSETDGAVADTTNESVDKPAVGAPLTAPTPVPIEQPADEAEPDMPATVARPSLVAGAEKIASPPILEGQSVTRLPEDDEDDAARMYISAFTALMDFLQSQTTMESNANACRLKAISAFGALIDYLNATEDGDV